MEKIRSEHLVSDRNGGVDGRAAGVKAEGVLAKGC